MKTETKVRKVVADILPKGEPFKLSWQPTGIGNYRVLRVITPAWRSLPRFERIKKVQEAIRARLEPVERKDIFRVSVLTEAELKRLRSHLPRGPRRTNGTGASASCR